MAARDEVLYYLSSNDGTKGEIAADSGFSSAYTSKVVNDLVAEGLVIEVDTGHAGAVVYALRSTSEGSTQLPARDCVREELSKGDYTRSELSASTGFSLGHVHSVVQELLDAGDVADVGERGRARLFGLPISKTVEIARSTLPAEVLGKI